MSFLDAIIGHFLRWGILVPLPVAGPLLMAAFLAATNHLMPRRIADALAFLTAVGAALTAAALFHASRLEPIVYWFGGWTPRSGVALGISFFAAPVGCGLAFLVALLVAAALMFSWRYFDTIGTLFHVLMLVFLAAMCGFALTADLFNLFVWFELMSAAAFALCGYKIEEAGPLQGALNFAITNTLGAFLVLSGIALLYSRTGALNLALIGRSLAPEPDRLVITAFVLIMCGFFVKAAVFPFHFWLADAHAVAPTPVCVLFSGVMVELGLYAVARVYWSVMDQPFAAHRPALRGLLLGVGVLTALLGGVMCFAQRHIKRLLAFSTVSHVGLLVIGFALLDPGALAGVFLYTIGHGLVKAALFLCAGILLHRLGTVDELDLHGRARRLRGTAAIWTAAALGLAAMPGFPTFLGEAGVDEAAENFAHHWVTWVFFVAGALTTGAALRVAGRVFGGFGGAQRGPTTGAKKIEDRPETKGPHVRVPTSMALPAAALVLAALCLGLLGGRAQRAANFAAAEITDRVGYQARVLEGVALPIHLPPEEHGVARSLGRSFATVLAAFALAGISLWQTVWSRPGARVLARALRPLRTLHSGHVGDYVTFLTFGVAAYGAVLILLLRRH